MWTFEERRKWKRKGYFREDFVRESCAYCFFHCPIDFCEDHDYFCDNFLPND